MNEEYKLSSFVAELKFEQIPADALIIAKHIIRAVIGTAIAGATEDGVAPLRNMLVERGGKAEATVFLYGDKLPATSAALVNGVMCRALDFCDAMAPGVHLGSSVVPAALAAAEYMGGCNGHEFLVALVVGTETGARLNLPEEAYDGFDPTGVAAVFGATAAAARIMRLNPDQTLHALALAFNRCGGSFQSNVDGSLAVRLIQGWVAESAVSCALLAKHGFTGPSNFLNGVYGYLHLYGRGKIAQEAVTNRLGEHYLLKQSMFKKYPSCGLTQGVTELAIQIALENDIEPRKITRAEIRLPSYAYKLVGHDFAIGRNARVNAQFSAQFCTANALVHRSSKLHHFSDESIRNAEILDLIKHVHVVPDETMNTRDHTAVELAVSTEDGVIHERTIEFSPGFPGNPLREEEHFVRFKDCMNYAARPLSAEQEIQLLKLIDEVETLIDIRTLLASLVI